MKLLIRNLTQTLLSMWLLIHVGINISERSPRCSKRSWCIPDGIWFPVICLISRWRHQTETFFALLALCAGNSPVKSPPPPAHKGRGRGALMFSLICAWINSWVNNREAGDLRRHRALYDSNRTKPTRFWVIDLHIALIFGRRLTQMSSFVARIGYVTLVAVTGTIIWSHCRSLNLGYP